MARADIIVTKSLSELFNAEKFIVNICTSAVKWAFGVKVGLFYYNLFDIIEISFGGRIKTLEVPMRPMGQIFSLPDL